MKRDIFIIVIIIIFASAMVITLRNPCESDGYSDDNPVLDAVRHNFSLLNPKYANIPLREGDSAYTENKRTITLCIKNPETGKNYSMNTIMYVALQELAHVVSKTKGHNEEFRRNFTILLKEAARIGIYNPGKEIPQTYCGVGPND